MRKVLSYLSIFLLILTSFPADLSVAQPLIESVDQKEEVILFAEEVDGEIELYESLDSILHEDPSVLIPDDTVVELLEHPYSDSDEELNEEYLSLLDEYLYIRYTEEADTSNEIILDSNEVEEIESEDLNYESNEHDIEINSSINNEYAEDSSNSDVYFNNVDDGEKIYEGFVHIDYVIEVEKADEFRESRLENPEDEVENIDELEEQVIEPFSFPVATSSRSMTAFALKQPVHVYKDTNRDSEILKSYNYGHLLKFRSYNDEWYSATVYINGDKHSGYIHHSDVGEKEEATSVYGVALKSTTNVYSKTDRKSNILKSYKKGHILKYRAHSKNWYSATVFISGKRYSGFIHAKDVETGVSNPETLHGVGIKQPTSVYQRANPSSVLKSYNYGSLLKFKEFTSDWYEATVFIKGNPKTGYIRKSDIGSMDYSLNGYAQKNPTHVYANTSKNSKSLKSYKIGSKLKYKPHNRDWYRATVINNGVREHGYIHAKDVGATAPQISGYAQKNPTIVYSARSRDSTHLKSYPKGAKLKYRYYNKNWYSATVINNGKRYNGYIHVNDVGNKAPSLTGYAHKNPTYVYAKNSTSSKKLKSYRRGAKLKFRYYNKNWYSATVYINGKKHSGFIHARDVGFSKQSNIVNPKTTYTYNRMTSDIAKLQNMYPDLIQYRVVGKSEYGRDIYAVGLGKGNTTTFINGSLHAREWITTSLNMYMIESYAKAYRNNSSIQGYRARSILNNTTIWFMPMVNPDGVTLQQQGLNAFPKSDHAKIIRYNGGSRNFKRWKANAEGVDINRNFGVHWSTQNSPKSPSFQNYRGPRAHSAKETQAVVNFVSEIRPRMTINYHSSGKVIYWKYRQSRANMNRDYRIARTIGNMTGYQLMGTNNGVKDSISGGGFLQYFTGTYNLPSITPELGRYAGNTNVSPSNFDRIWRQNRAVGLYAAQESYKTLR